MSFAEVLRRRIALIAIGNGIGQLAARRNFAGENPADGVSALHSALPDIEHRTEPVAVFIHPRHIYNIAAVYQHNGVFEIRGHLVEQRGFIVGQIIATLLSVFPCPRPRSGLLRQRRSCCALKPRQRSFRLSSSHRGSAATSPKRRHRRGFLYPIGIYFSVCSSIFIPAFFMPSRRLTL